MRSTYKPMLTRTRRRFSTALLLISMCAVLGSLWYAWEQQTESKLAQHVIVDLEGLLLNSKSAVIVVDATGTIIAWNKSATGLFGWTADEVVGSNLAFLIPKEYWLRHHRAFQSAVTTGAAGRHRYFMTCHTNQADGGRVDAVITVIRTHRKPRAAGGPSPQRYIAIIDRKSDTVVYDLLAPANTQ